MKPAFRLVVISLIALMAVASAQHEAATPTHSGTTQSTSDSASAKEGEAAKETDSHKQLTESPSVKWLADKLGLTVRQAYWLSVLLNFAVLAGFVGFMMKSNLPAVFRERSAAIKKGMEDAKRASDDATRRLIEIESRLAKLDGEIHQMRAGVEREAKAGEERLRSATEEEKRHIVQSAELEIGAATTAARRDLKRYAADLAIALAEKKIAVSAEVDKALVKNFARDLDDNQKGRD